MRERDSIELTHHLLLFVLCLIVVSSTDSLKAKEEYES